MTKKVTFDGEAIPFKDLPSPAGWRILLAPIHVSEQTSGGIFIPKAEVQAEEHLRFVGKVLAMGPLCFTKEEHRYTKEAPVKPWCVVGDIISTSQYAGSTLPCDVNGEQFYLRVINDEEVVSIIPNISVLNI